MFDLLPNEYFLFVFFLIGLCFGSFANVLIYRIPKNQSVVTPRSACPHCNKEIAWYDNIPLFSFLWLRARCRACQYPISVRYFIVELLMGALFAALFFRFGWTWYFLEVLIFVFALVVVSFIDIDHMILPDVFTLSGIGIGLLGAALNPEREFMPAVFGVLFGGGFLWAIAYIYYAIRKEEGMGGGDIKLLAWMGAVLGWSSIPFVILSSSLVGSVIGLLVAYKQKSGIKTAIPFGPYLALGAILYLLGGDGIGRWYLSLFLVNS